MRSDINRPQFGQGSKAQCGVPGCDGTTEFWECEKCHKYICNKHFHRSIATFVVGYKCPLCGLKAVKKL
jgi:hypothetical protein